MWMRSRLVLSLVAGFLLLSGSAGIDPGELACEEAVKHLFACCGDTDPAVLNITCYAERGCGNAMPDFDPRLASCLRDASCEEIYASGACRDPKTATCGR
jgi:hypothetical protein